MGTREAVVAEARSWIGTPYQVSNPIKGAGVDCGMLLVAVYRACGILPDNQRFQELFRPDWWAHATKDRYRLIVMKWALQASEREDYPSTAHLPPEAREAGNVLLVRTAGSKVFNHGGIITAWPLIVHAVKPAAMEVNCLTNAMWIGNPVAAFNPFAKVDSP